jgi:hypothetical protein
MKMRKWRTNKTNTNIMNKIKFINKRRKRALMMMKKMSHNHRAHQSYLKKSVMSLENKQSEIRSNFGHRDPNNPKTSSLKTAITHHPNSQFNNKIKLIKTLNLFYNRAISLLQLRPSLLHPPKGFLVFFNRLHHRQLFSNKQFNRIKCK